MVGLPPPTWAVDVSGARAFAIRPGVWRLRLPSPWHHLTHANAWAVDHPDGGIVLFDCGGAGHPSTEEALDVALTEAGRALEDVRDLVLTHFHSDHVGAAARVASVSGCTVWGHPARSHLTEPLDHPEATVAHRRALALAAGVPAGELAPYLSLGEEREGVEGRVRVDRELRDGTVVETAVGPWVAYETPGHAPSHVAFHQPDTGLLVSGDLVNPVFTTYCDLGDTDDPIGAYERSLGVLAGLDVTLALPGHGRALADLPALVTLYRDGIAGRLAAVEAALRRVPGPAYGVMEAVFPDRPNASATVWRLCETLGYLTRLERLGRAASEPAGDGLVHHRALS